ncbi:uncharacterized protein LOC125946418 [Dermacentor silvarum]|uniref:uncharacterized protein LOC125946418 n=1 Tax=Dermacentor silvarum TaxID=543639 RepID=UPI002101AACA|nr:uncharacterized protein LOC125946418 [Dermacentor silvarum]
MRALFTIWTRLRPASSTTHCEWKDEFELIRVKARHSLQVPAEANGCQGPCWRPSGLFPDPADCCGFFSCASCRAYRLRCAPGTVFDRRLGLCNHPHDAPVCLAPNPGCYLYYLSSSLSGKK